jgi:hypothetical protein
MIGQELHKIGRRDRKIPISKIGRTAWQNLTDSKNRTDFGFSCKLGVTFPKMAYPDNPEVASSYSFQIYVSCQKIPWYDKVLFGIISYCLVSSGIVWYHPVLFGIIWYC